MRLTNRSKKRHRSHGPRISISQDEITANLNYHGSQPRRARETAPMRAARGRR